MRKPRRKNGTGSIRSDGYRYFRGKKYGTSRKYGHILVAEKALGKPLLKGAIVHHIDGDTSNNRPNNLVVCPDQTYHMLLEKRTRALNACGNPNYYKCWYCKKYDDPKNMWLRHDQLCGWHRTCHSIYQRNLRRLHKAQIPSLWGS